MKKKWNSPKTVITPVDMEGLGEVSQLSDAELKIKMEQAGYKFQKMYQASESYILDKIAGSDVLIPVGFDVPYFREYVKISGNMVFLWRKMQNPCQLDELVDALVETFKMSYEIAVQEVLDFVNLLKEYNMIAIQ